MKPRLLILTAGFGEGHNAAARALATACDLKYGAGSARIVDAFALAAPRTNAISRDAYLSLINRAPKIWSVVYRWIDRSKSLPRLFELLRRETKILAEIIAADRPEVICSTYPAYAFLIEKLARAGRSRG